MERISETINKIYLKYLPIVKRVGVTLDVDFPDTTLTIREKERVERDLDKTMESAVKRAKNNGRIVIQVRKGKIIIKDNGTILSKTTCDLLSTEHVKVESRLGFGTTVTIQAKHQDKIISVSFREPCNFCRANLPPPKKLWNDPCGLNAPVRAVSHSHVVALALS